MAEKRQKIAFLWNNFTEYHVDRLMAASKAMPEHEIFGVELAASTINYDWKRPDHCGLRIETLFDQSYQSISATKRVAALIRCVLRERPDVIFFCHFERPEVFASALLQVFRGRTAIIMMESNWNDCPRSLKREVFKLPLFAPYAFGLVGGPASARYLEHFGLPPERIRPGYDTVSGERMRRLANANAADIAFDDRPIVVISRLIAKKNLLRLLEGYAQYRRLCPAPRRLEILGNGPEENALRTKIATDGIDGVELPGFLDQKDVATRLSRALCLVLFSTVEQWGLAVNEAIALEIPVIVSSTVNAASTLVRNRINGAVIEPDNTDGLARTLAELSGNESLWRSWSEGCRVFQKTADTESFGAGAAALTAFAQQRKPSKNVIGQGMGGQGMGDQG